MGESKRNHKEDFGIPKKSLTLWPHQEFLEQIAESTEPEDGTVTDSPGQTQVSFV